MHMHMQMHRDSIWQPYLRILPSSYSTVLYWTPEELMLLKGTSLFGDALAQVKHIARQYAYIHKQLDVSGCVL